MIAPLTSRPMEKIEKLVLGLTAAGFTMLVGWIDAELLESASLWLLYLLPIWVVSWFLGRRLGAVMGVLAGSLAFYATLGNGLLSEGVPWGAIWNLVSVGVVFAFAAWVPGRLRSQLLEQSRLARQDVLTHIPNRLDFTERLPLEMSVAAGRRAPVTLGLVEVHGLAYVNDRFGTQAGDLLLRATAKTLRDHIGKDDLIGRISGTTFAVVLLGRGEEAARKILEGVREAVLRQVNLYDRPISVAIAAVSTDRPTGQGQDLLDRTGWLLQSIKQDRTLHPFRVIGDHEIRA